MASSIRYLEYLVPVVIIYFVFGIPGLDWLNLSSLFASSTGSIKSSQEASDATKRTIQVDSSNFINHNLPHVQCPLTTSTKIHIYSRQPLVIYLESFLDTSEIDAIIEITTPNLVPALVGSGADTLNANSQIRNSTTAALPVDHELSICIARRAQALQGWPQDLWLEKLMAQRYIAPYGHYSHHYDWAAPGGKEGRRRAGGRQSSFMAWLNNPQKGGGTNFPRLPLPADTHSSTSEWCRFVECGPEATNKYDGTTFKPIKGNAVFWENFQWDDGGLVEQTWHAGLPVEEGEKWGLNVWSWWLPGWKAHAEKPGQLHTVTTLWKRRILAHSYVCTSHQATMATTSKAGGKLHGRAFYESIGSPRVVLAPMAWRMLTRSFLPPELKQSILAYTPMFHARLFADNTKYRDGAFEPVKTSLTRTPSAETPLDTSNQELRLDGNPEFDRPLFVQFCANKPDELFASARYVQPFCDAVDLNLGCPQGIARKGHYGAFLQEDWKLIYSLINKLHLELAIPVTAKMRVLETKEKTLDYAKMILSAGASIITVHGRQREQKGHYTGLADWSTIRYLRDNLPKETVIFANGNILQHEDIEACLEATGADAVMSAEGNLYDPSIFAAPPRIGEEGRDYWRGRDGRGGYRMDAVFRRYLDIIYTHVLGAEPPARRPLFVVGDEVKQESGANTNDSDQDGPPRKKQKVDKKTQRTTSPNLGAMQPHLFHMLRPLVSKQTHVRDALAKARSGDIAEFETVLALVEEAVMKGMLDYAGETTEEKPDMSKDLAGKPVDIEKMSESSLATVAKCRRPWFICQPYVRPLPKEAVEKGAITLSKKEKARLQADEAVSKEAGVASEGKVEQHETNGKSDAQNEGEKIEVPKQGMVCG
ncbi:hypothetical protein FH972_025110 [Carpinus fangiana]|uniref:tRNA-dihydrouridine(16/17) synthase [NAD(P)(+)] n=1 Tax=Carpinus fangiana TaxID=176857 RepID=A0A5N6L0F6_9ROSI|nr:hypothetical protein FH972_025110 [Carpinus fangiana]